MGERCQNFGLKSVQLKKNGVEFGTTFIFIPVVYRQKYIYYSFASSKIPWIFSTDFYFILNKVAPICLVKEFYISSCFTKWLDDKKRWWLILFFFSRDEVLCLFSACHLIALSMYLSEWHYPQSILPSRPIILKFWNTQYSAKGKQSVFVHRRENTCGRCPCIFQGGSAHLPVWAQVLIFAQW